jgi:hypothetical protein
VAVAWFSRRENLFLSLKPGLPLEAVLGVGAAAGVLCALAVLGLYRFVPAYARALRPAADLLRRAPRGWLWALALVSPLTEGFFFWGALQPLVGVFGTAAAFGLLHTGFRRALGGYGLTACGVGLVFGLVYGFLGELWAPVVAHLLYNVLVLVSLPLFP